MKKILLIILTVTFIGCSNRVYFTKEIRGSVEGNKNSLTKIQYYINRKLILERATNKDITEIQKGKVQEKDGIILERVILKKRTPGICTDIYKDSLHISWEASKTLTFYLLKGRQASQCDVYELFPYEDDKEAKTRSISYDGKIYIQDKYKDVKLMVKKADAQSDSVVSRKMEGIKIK